MKIGILFCFFGVVFLSVANADTPLEISMKHISKAYKQLALDLKQPEDASKADYLVLTATMKSEAQIARGLVPKKAADLPTDQQAAMVTAYQKSMDDLGATIDDLSQDIQNSKWDDALKAIHKLGQQESEGHKAFRNKETQPLSTTVTSQPIPPKVTPPPAASSPTAPPVAPQTTP